MQKNRQVYQANLITKEPVPKFVELVCLCRGSGRLKSGIWSLPCSGSLYRTQIPGSGPIIKKTCAQVYEDFARYALEICVNFVLLRYMFHVPLEERMDGLASWAPDWSRTPTCLPRWSQYPYDGYTTVDHSYLWLEGSSVLVFWYKAGRYPRSKRGAFDLFGILRSNAAKTHSTHLVTDVLSLFEQHHMIWRQVIGARCTTDAVC
jgi:hypothetical protein